ncbi:MAG TPA: HAD-IIIA family hydrolase [Gemmatimonadaceae bacterium]|nr:HAD-IIIA family hydrolase [Gemmatimonadaceae bacterium]
MIDRARAARVRLVGFDIDGTLTDGGIYLGAIRGEDGPQTLEFKKYDIQDGLGISFLRAAGIKVVIVTGRTSESVRLRAAELKVDGVAQDPDARKLPMWRKLLARHRVNEEDAAFVGDDIPDLSIMSRVGMAVAVGNAVPEIAKIAHVKLKRHGGHGAVREFAEMLLHARGEWNETIDRYVTERSTTKRGATR